MNRHQWSQYSYPDHTFASNEKFILKMREDISMNLFYLGEMIPKLKSRQAKAGGQENQHIQPSGGGKKNKKKK